MKTFRLREDKSLEDISGDVLAMGAAFRADRKVGNTRWPLPDGETLVLSTVFLVIDHDGNLFETMAHIDDGAWGDAQPRYPAWKEARAAHEKLAKAIGVAIESCKTADDALEIADGILVTL